MKKYTVRFHLGAGENYMHWRVKNNETGEVNFYDPAVKRLVLTSCKLRNSPSGAQKIKDGADKSVVAWVDAHKVVPFELETSSGYKEDLEYYTHVRYNPRVVPYWHHEGDEETNIDNSYKTIMTTVGSKLYV